MDFQKIDNSIALPLWNDLALTQTGFLTIAHNPALFDFFSDYLQLKPYYLILYCKDKQIGLLPLVKTGKKLISVPHFSNGGIHWLQTEPAFSFDESELILNIADQIESRKLKAGFFEVKIPSSLKPREQSVSVEIRSFKSLFNNSNTNKVVHLMELKETEEEQNNAYSSNLRRKVNKSKRNKLTIQSGKIELVDDFSKVYDENMHRIGSPTLGKKFFNALLNVHEANAKIFVTYLNEKPIGGAFAMWYDGYYENTWFSTLVDYNHLYPSYLLHDEMIKDAIRNNASIYSMGRSTKGSGVQQYKLQWPVEEKELFFNTNFKSGFSLKEQKWLTKIWKRLPGAIVNRIGPVVAKRIY